MPAFPAVSDIVGLYSALVKAGIVGAPGAPPLTSNVVNEPKLESTDSSSKMSRSHKSPQVMTHIMDTFPHHLLLR
jgi:hypothetical protein